MRKEISRTRIPADWFSDLDALRRVIARADVVNQPSNLRFSTRRLGWPSDFRIATISSSLRSDLTSSSRLGYRVWITANKKTRARLRTAFMRDLDKAANAGATFVCFNEMAYPTPIDREEDKEFKLRIIELVRRHGIFLVGGSYHDTRRFYNICPVFSPVPEVGGPKDTRVWSHAKLTSAVKVFEMVRVPSDRNLRYYETEYGTFTILIGLDVYNPELVLRLMKMNYFSNPSEKIDLIFVPSFSLEKSLSLAEVCRDLSYLTASIVVYVNCSGNEPRHAVYVAGQSLPFSRNDKPRSNWRSRKISSSVMLHEISYDHYHQVRVGVSDEYAPIFNYLIGQKGGLRFNLLR